MLSLQTWINYLQIDSKYENENDKKKIIQFVFLWMKYNEYYNDKYGNLPSRLNNGRLMGDKEKALGICTKKSVVSKYANIKKDFISKFNQIAFDDGTINRQYLISRDGTQTPYNLNNESLEDFLNVVYKIRCNFFHGDKEPIRVDIELIGWAYDCLNELLEGII